MQQIFNQLLQFLQQGIAAIFKFVQLIWTWSTDQIIRVFNAPWQNWPLWKQILLLVLIGGIVYFLYKAVMELWEAGEKALRAFAGLLGAFIGVLPRVLIAGVLALGGLWFLTNVDLGKVWQNVHLTTPWSAPSTR